ncbi:MAG: alpha/beta fold hydrolase [Phycisphaerae bacterium]
MNPTRTVEFARTADGANLALLRRESAGGPPVLLFHGIAVNADIWDLPDIRGDGFHYRSLASLLHEAGCDVWLVNLRGHGSAGAYSAPPMGLRDWCVDHYVLYDAPAALAHVRRRTGKRPFVVGSSMGAIVLGAYLQGATLHDAGTVTAADALAAQRQAEIAGGVFVEFPAALRWPGTLYGPDGALDWGALRDGWRNTHIHANFPFEILARWLWLQGVVELLGEVRLDWLRPAPNAAARHAARPEALRRVLDYGEQSFAHAVRELFVRFKGAEHFRVETFTQGLRLALDHMKAGVLRQFAACVRQRSIVSALGTTPHVYSDHYGCIASPTLLVLGGRDRIAHPEITRAVFYDAIRASDKTLALFENMAHGEFEYAPEATDLVYPRIREWILKRTAECGART